MKVYGPVKPWKKFQNFKKSLRKFDDEYVYRAREAKEEGGMGETPSSALTEEKKGIPGEFVESLEPGGNAGETVEVDISLDTIKKDIPEYIKTDKPGTESTTETEDKSVSVKPKFWNRSTKRNVKKSTVAGKNSAHISWSRKETHRWRGCDLLEEHEDNPDVYISLVLRDLIIYLIFLLILTMVALGSMSLTTYLYSFVLSDILTKTAFQDGENTTTTFRDLRTVDQLWLYIMDIFVNKVVCKDSSPNLLPTPGDNLYILNNLVLGVPRIRQVRVRNDSCVIPPDFEEFFTECFDYYSYLSESREPYGDKTGSEWTFTDGIAAKYYGRVSTYYSGGYYLNFTKDCLKTKTALEDLKKKKWIDAGTRAVFLDFTTYSPNVNLFCITKLVAELPPSGGVVTLSSFRTLRFIRYHSLFGMVILSFELLVVIFLAYYTFQELRKIIFYKWTYFKKFWSWIELTIIMVGWALIAFGIWRFLSVAVYLPQMVDTIKSDDHVSLEDVSWVQETFESFLALLVALSWFKLLKYLMLFKTIYKILIAVSKVATELIGLAFLIFILLLSFALFGYLIYGQQAEEFGSLGNSLVSLSLLTIGALDYQNLLSIRPIIAPLFFLAFIFLYILIFLSLFIGVLVNGFITTRLEMRDNDKKRVSMKEILFKFLYNLLLCMRCQAVANAINKKITESKAKDDFKMLLELLKRSGFRGKEIDLFLQKHKITEGQPISEEKINEIYQEIDLRGQLYFEAKEHEQIMMQLERLKTKMAVIDKSTEEMSAKVDLLFDKIIRSK